MNERPNIRQMVLDLVLDDNYKPLKARAIAKKLDLLDDEREVKRSIKRLVKNGKLRYGDKHLVRKPAKGKKPEKVKADRDRVKDDSGKKFKRKDNEVVGTFRKTSGGFGFVTPEDSVVTDRSEDIFVPRSRTGDAAHMDKVIVRIPKEEKGGPKGRGKRGKKAGKGPAGRIVRVLERYTHRFVGTYSENNGYGIVTVDGGTFEQGILVGDAGARRCKVGDKVVIEMADFPSARSPGEGVIVEVFGDRGQPGVDTRMIIAEFGLPEEFPDAVLEDARRQAEAFDEEIGDRTDFTKKTVITIDPKTARDFDDAISLEQIENGHWLLGVHIADVSHFVPFRSALDAEAYDRSTSVYLPDKVIPMLPEIISNNLASLQPDRVRYCMTALIEFTDKGVPIATELHRGAIKSAHRFNYEEIDDYLENDKPWKEKLEPDVFRVVRDMHTLAMKLRKRRMDRGAINLVLPEVRIDLDDDGKVCGAHTEDNTESHQVIEEFMLAANEAVAQRLEDEGLFLIRRIHESPTEKKLQELTNFVQSLGIDCDNLQDRFELKRVVEESESMKESHAIHFAVLRTMQKAVYSPQEVGHYALASPAYCHFTSPIRRYPDLVIHRMVGDLVDGKKPKSNFDSLASLGKHCSNLEKRAADAERELKKLKLLSFMEDKIGETLTGVITGVESFGLFVQGIEIPAEGLIPIDSLPKDNYTYERYSRSLSGAKKKNQFRLGDQVVVEVAVVDWDKRNLEYRLKASDPTSGTKRKPGGSRKDKPTRERASEAIAKGKPKPASKPKEFSKPRESSKPEATSKPKPASKRKSKAKKEEQPWEKRRARGKTRKHREAAKKKKYKPAKKTDSGKSRKAQANKKKSKAAAKKAARKTKVATARAKQKKKGKKRKKS